MKTSQEEINDQPGDPTSDNQVQSCTKLSLPLEVEDCAFEGAMITLVPITDAAHLIHGPSGCIGNTWGNGVASGSILHKVRFTTDMEESDIIFGGAKKLYRAIIELVRRYKPAAVFVYSTCVSALIGDDIIGVCKAATEQTKTPVIPVDAPGFVGRQNQGIRLASEVLLEYVIGTAEPDYTTSYDINLISECNITTAMWNVLPLLAKLGIRVLAKITGDVTYKEICYAHRAKLNVMISAKALLKMPKKMEERFGIPYIEESFYGIEETNRFLRNIAAKLGEPDLQERTENLIAAETAALNHKLAPYHDRLQRRCIVLGIDSLQSWSIISLAKYFQIEVFAFTTKKSTQDDRARIKRLLGENAIILEQKSHEDILQIINENHADILIASDRCQPIALSAKIPFLNINHELHRPYAGYAGILNVARELYTSLYNPIWQQIDKSAPWD